ncbi:MAG: histidine kinase [Ferruginibacter sp.]|nr:histidine kinase [Ferruginibacter sp.]
MRLLTKTTLYFLLAMVPLLTAGGFYLFHQFSRELNQEMDAELLNDEVQWVRYIAEQTENGGPFILKTPELLIYPVDEDVSNLPTVTDTYQFQAIVNANVPYRQLSQVLFVRGIPYQVIIRKSKVQQSVLVTNVTRIMFFVFTGLFAVTLLFNWFISKRLWKPFQRSLEKINSAELQKMEAVYFDKDTSVQEFNELNAALNTMANKIHNDYITMKEFTEDAAHEMQTPLAVAQSKLELLLQDTGLNDEQASSIVEASTAIKRLARLNQSLLLLAKIDNNQYETNETISLNAVTSKYLSFFDAIIKDKAIKVAATFNGDFNIKMHPMLAESLVSNLVGNAIKYNYTGGNILIDISSNHYSISNTSEFSAIAPGLLFKRFKNTRSTDDNSNGMGLAIVKKIADTHQLAISYSAEKGVHQFIITKKGIHGGSSAGNY